MVLVRFMRVEAVVWSGQVATHFNFLDLQTNEYKILIRRKGPL